jgi:uncharacterized membrane protein
LSYFGFSYLTNTWVFFLGILVPFVIFFFRPTEGASEKEKTYQKETFLFPDALTVWILLGLIAFFIRILRLTQFYLWPTGDEALHGFLALSLLKNWNWQFFYTVGEHPPLLIWMLALLFKVFKSTFWAMWFLPAMISFMTIPVGYLCGKELLSKSASVLFCFLLAFSFWPIYLGRFCHQGLFIPLWELLSFFLMSRWIKNTEKLRGFLWPSLLGMWCGLGTLTFISWIFVLFLLLTFIFIYAYKKKLPNVLWFFTSLAAGLLPFVLALLNEGYGHHLTDSSGLTHWFSGAHQLITHFSYLTSLFWGSLQSDTSYGPIWGGILNPVLTSCFFIGILDLYQKRREVVSRWIGFAFIICLLPSFLAGDYVELNRIIQVMPFLLLIVVWGLQRLLLEIEDRKKATAALLGLLFLSSFLDANHLLITPLEYFKSRKFPSVTTLNPDLKAYQILNSVYADQGAGVIFTDFLPVQYGHSLFVATYPFNSAFNPALDPRKATWAAILTNINYQPFLFKRFPESKWYWTYNGTPSMAGGLAVGILPITSGNRATIKNWMKAQDIFHQLQLEAEGSYNQKKTYEETLQHLIKSYDEIRGDRFVEACYWEWCSQYYFSPSYAENIVTLQRAIEEGYPAAHLYQKLSGILSDRHEETMAKKAMVTALREEPKFEIENNFEIKNFGN